MHYFSSIVFAVYSSLDKPCVIPYLQIAVITQHCMCIDVMQATAPQEADGFLENSGVTCSWLHATEQ